MMNNFNKENKVNNINKMNNMNKKRENKQSTSYTSKNERLIYKRKNNKSNNSIINEAIDYSNNPQENKENRNDINQNNLNNIVCKNNSSSTVKSLKSQLRIELPDYKQYIDLIKKDYQKSFLHFYPYNIITERLSSSDKQGDYLLTSLSNKMNLINLRNKKQYKINFFDKDDYYKSHSLLDLNKCIFDYNDVSKVYVSYNNEYINNCNKSFNANCCVSYMDLNKIKMIEDKMDVENEIDNNDANNDIDIVIDNDIESICDPYSFNLNYPYDPRLLTNSINSNINYRLNTNTLSHLPSLFNQQLNSRNARSRLPRTNPNQVLIFKNMVNIDENSIAVSTKNCGLISLYDKRVDSLVNYATVHPGATVTKILPLNNNISNKSDISSNYILTGGDDKKIVLSDKRLFTCFKNDKNINKSKVVTEFSLSHSVRTFNTTGRGCTYTGNSGSYSSNRSNSKNCLLYAACGSTDENNHIYIFDINNNKVLMRREEHSKVHDINIINEDYICISYGSHLSDSKIFKVDVDYNNRDIYEDSSEYDDVFKKRIMRMYSNYSNDNDDVGLFEGMNFPYERKAYYEDQLNQLCSYSNCNNSDFFNNKNKDKCFNQNSLRLVAKTNYDGNFRSNYFSVVHENEMRIKLVTYSNFGLDYYDISYLFNSK